MVVRRLRFVLPRSYHILTFFLSLQSRLQSEHPSHPLVHDMAEKSDLFDTAVAKLTVPALPVVSV